MVLSIIIIIIWSHYQYQIQLFPKRKLKQWPSVPSQEGKEVNHLLSPLLSPRDVRIREMRAKQTSRTATEDENCEKIVAGVSFVHCRGGGGKQEKEGPGFRRMMGRRKAIRGTFWTWLPVRASLPAPNVPSFSHSCKPQGETVREYQAPLLSGKQLLGGMSRQQCAALPHRAPQRLWQLPGKEESSVLHVWRILKQNKNCEIWWTLTGGRREWKRWNKDAILKLLAWVQDFTIFYGKEQVKKSLLLMSIFL